MLGRHESTICNKHNTIMFYIKELKKKLKKLNIEDENISELLNKINLEARDAKKSGQRMENRLKQYRNSIEKLGYIRSYK